MHPDPERLARADALRRDADLDDRRAAEEAERNPSWSEMLARRARWKRRIANDEDGGLGR